MSNYLPLQKQQTPPPPPPPPPAVMTTQEPFATHGGGAAGGSIGPVIAAVALVTILGVVAALVGRLCAGRSIYGRGHCDVERWMDANCSSCIDGSIDPPPPPTAAAHGGGSGAAHS